MSGRLVPMNLMAWPRITNLVPDLKLVIYHLWATCEEACGCKLIETGRFQGELNLTRVALDEVLNDFEQRKLIAIDRGTGEIFIVDWFRFHTFKTGPRQRLLKESIARIQSSHLKALVLEKSVGCVPREGKGREGKGREGKGREGKGMEGKGREGKGREGKGREGKGREGKPPPPPPPLGEEGSGGGGGDQIEDILLAAEWAEIKAGNPPRSPVSWRRKVRTRLLEKGPNKDDLTTLAAWKKATQNTPPPPPPPRDPRAGEKARAALAAAGFR